MTLPADYAVQHGCHDCRWMYWVAGDATACLMDPDDEPASPHPCGKCSQWKEADDETAT
jgi:hypothetical protein